MCWHKWSKWEKVLIESSSPLLNLIRNKHSSSTEIGQEKTCLKCGKIEIRKLDS